MTHGFCQLCFRRVKAWFTKTELPAHRGWRCMFCEQFFCDECAPQDGTGKHCETACWLKWLRENRGALR